MTVAGMERMAGSSSAAFSKERGTEEIRQESDITKNLPFRSFIIDLTVTYIEQKWGVMLDKWRETV